MFSIVFHVYLPVALAWSFSGYSNRSCPIYTHINVKQMSWSGHNVTIVFIFHTNDSHVWAAFVGCEMDEGSSTGTEDAGHYEAAKLKKRAVNQTRRKGPAQKVIRVSARDARWDGFKQKFSDRLLSCQRNGTGCYFCRHDCFMKVEPLLEEVKTWRENMQALASEVMDREILWIFQFSRAKTEDDPPVTKKRVAAKVPCENEDGSTTETEMEDASDHDKSSGTSTSNPDAGSDDSELDLSKAAPSSLVRRVQQQAKRDYSTRCQTKKPSVKLSTFIKGADKLVVICVQTALFLLGIGYSRLQRVLHGRPDNRKRGFRVQHQVEAKAFDTCMRFLQLRYHNEGEYLPDRFVFEGALKDRSLMIIAESEMPEAQPTLSDGSDSEMSDVGRQDDLDEADSRALSALAIKSVVLNNPFSNSLTGPGAAPGPRRWLGVMKPCTMYQMLLLWCKQCNLSAPSFTTFRRALRAASPWLTFRKSAGQHGLCDSCLHFKKALRDSCRQWSVHKLLKSMLGICCSTGEIGKLTGPGTVNACKPGNQFWLGSPCSPCNNQFSCCAATDLTKQNIEFQEPLRIQRVLRK